MSADVGSLVGRHVLAELHGVSRALLDDEQLLSGVLESALTEAGAQVRELVSSRFEPEGVTVLALLSESHASLHTYPEVRAAYVDVFTCGQQADPARALTLIAAGLAATGCRSRTVSRRLDDLTA